MTKISKKIVIAVAMLTLLVMIFAGCADTYKWGPIAGGDKDAVVENNGGLAVKQGEYIYYINGRTATSDITKKEDNTFGKVTKGAIMRGKLDNKGNVKDPVIVVPLMSLSSNKEGGIFVFGGYIYYTTPSIATDREGALQTGFLDYMRTSIDGSKTEKIATVEGASTVYKFASDALIYYKDNKITRIPYDDNSIGKEETVAEDVTGVVFPQNKTYDPKNTPIDDVIFYTKASEDEEATYNVTYVVSTKSGSEAKEIINGSTYTDSNDKKAQFTISLKQAIAVSNGIELYYEKACSANTENPAGLHGALYSDGKLAVDKEKRFTDKTYSTVLPISLEDGVYVVDSNKLYKMMEKKNADGTLSFFDRDAVIDFGASVNVVKFVDYSFDNGAAVPSVVYIKDSVMEVRALDDSLDYNTKIVNSVKVDTTWLMPEVIDGKIYFFNSDYYTYVDVIDLVSGEMYLTKDENDRDVHPLANLSVKDSKTEQDKIKAEEEDKK